MIDYETYCKIRHYHSEKKLSFAQIAVELGLHAETASKYARMEKFVPRVGRKRSSKLDAFKPMITRLLERYPYSAAQLLIRLREEGYTGGSTILNSYVRAVRPVRHRAFLTLAFEPGEAAQVDWGSAGSI